MATEKLEAMSGLRRSLDRHQIWDVREVLSRRTIGTEHGTLLNVQTRPVLHTIWNMYALYVIYLSEEEDSVKSFFFLVCFLNIT